VIQMKNLKSSWSAILGAACLLTAIAAFSNTAGAQSLKKPCCIAGDYEGTFEDTLSRTCPEPKKGKFTMTVSQENNCGPKVWGKIDQHERVPLEPPQDWEGTVQPNPAKRCCEIKGKFGHEDETIEFTICLRFKDGKWSGTGTYKQTHEAKICLGVWSIGQI